ncbi:acyl-ACP--UDP-N-acetylglucosamine O-acyltransferase [candidate division WOR-3 bacterium]|nr:acyl-ACP--UDP-N-acetylglucosamine O-acyltransferase [candidate division WOR-3 bacterium]
MQIHKTAVVDKNASLGKNIKVGAYSFIEADVEIGDGCEIGNYVCIKNGTKIGENNKIYEGVVIGNPPQDIKFKGGKSHINIGSNNIIREYVTIHRATEKDKKTVVGDENYIMAYCHLAHDVRIGNGVIIVNATQIAGFVEVFDCAFISGLCPIHQFVRIGEYSMIGGGYRVPKDVLPYSLSVGNPLLAVGVNIIGLQRHNFSKQTIGIIKRVFNLLLSKEFNTRQAIDRIRDEFPMTKEVKRIVEFIESSERGVALK